MNRYCTCMLHDSWAPEAQPLQDLLDRMIYRMAGLTDTEARGLEERLSRML